MEIGDPARSAEDRRRHGILLGLVVGLAAIAYRGLAAGAFSSTFEDWVFLPGALPPLLSVSIAGALLLWRQTRGAIGGSPAPRTAAALAGLGAACFAWAQWTGAAHLLVPSLAANGLALAAAVGGGAACRAVLVPTAVLLLGLPLPKPLEDEVLWQLQQATAQGAGALLEVFGRDFVRNAVILRDDAQQYRFHVIEGCSGLNGIVILTLVALIVCEVFAGARRRVAWVVAAAPLLGLALNIVRVASVAASHEPEALAGAAGDHTPQGITVVMAGTVGLYALGALLAGRGRPDAQEPPDARRTASSEGPWRVAVAVLVALVGLSVAVPRYEPAQDAPLPAAFPFEKDGWTSKLAPGDDLFLGPLSGGFHRRFTAAEGAGTAIVDLLVGYEHRDPRESFRLLSSKRFVPGPDWTLVRSEPVSLFALGREGSLSIARRTTDGPHAVLVGWTARHGSLWEESWRSLLALEASPFRRARPAVVVRLVSIAPHDGQLELDRARQRIDRFLLTFREELLAR